MNGIHDMGGMEGFGPIERDKDEPVFADEWEGRIMGMTLATLAQGFYNVDEIRQETERMEPVEYLTSRYYTHWLHTAEELLIQKGLITREELKAKQAELASSSGAESR